MDDPAAGRHPLDVTRPLSTAGDVYLHVALWALGSYAVTAALTLVLRLRTSVVMVLLGGGAAALYYWFAADTITTAFALPDAGTLAIRVGALALVATWGWRALREEPSLVLERG